MQTCLVDIHAPGYLLIQESWCGKMEEGDTRGHQDVKYMYLTFSNWKFFNTASDNKGRGHDWQEDAKFEEACKSVSFAPPNMYPRVQPRIGRQANLSMHMQQKQIERRPWTR